MKYLVITSKHHEGFCLWGSQYTDYKATNTPYGKDLLKQVVEAFRGEGLRVGFYYSLIDWHNPHYTVDGMHPQRDHPDLAALNQGRDMAIYAQYLHNQVRELLTNFGQIDILYWCDFSYPSHEYRGMKGKGRADLQSEKLVKMVRELQPGILIDDRLDLPESADIRTPEQWQPTEWIRVDGDVGAAVGGGAGAMKRRGHQKQQQQAQQQAAQKQQTDVQAYHRALGVCMEGRGYQVG